MPTMPINESDVCQYCGGDLDMESRYACVCKEEDLAEMKQIAMTVIVHMVVTAKNGDEARRIAARSVSVRGNDVVADNPVVIMTT